MNVEDILRSLALTQGDRDAELRRSLGIAGLSMLGARKGQEWQRLGASGLMGMDAYQQGLAAAQQGKISDFKMREIAQGMVDAQRKQEQAQQDQQALSQLFSGGPNLGAMGPGGPTPANAAAVVPSRIEQYRKAADFYASRGNPEAAKKFSDMAAQMEEEFSTTPQVVRGADGKLQLVQFGKRGQTKTAEGMTPAEKLHFANTGAQVGVGIDPYTGQQVSGGLAATMDPAQADASKRGWAQYQLSKNADQRAAAAAKGGDKPQWDSATGQFVYAPTAEAPSGRAVKPEGYVAKPSEASKKEADSLDAQLNVVRAARKAADETPSAFSLRRGMATMAGPIPESLAGRMDSTAERNARSYVFNTVSKVINERAGAAQSVQELARLRSFLPAEADNAEQVKDKLDAFESYLQEQRKVYGGKPASATGEWGKAEKVPN